MAERICITGVTFIAASPAEVETGLLGWMSFDVNDLLRLDGVALRKTADDRIVLSFPCRRDRRGKRHALVRPIDDRAREEIERAVLSTLGLDEVPTS
jgi:DNA-binding cell septation regulator SpoVG